MKPLHNILRNTWNILENAGEFHSPNSLQIVSTCVWLRLKIYIYLQRILSNLYHEKYLRNKTKTPKCNFLSILDYVDKIFYFTICIIRLMNRAEWSGTCTMSFPWKLCVNNACITKKNRNRIRSYVDMSLPYIGKQIADLNAEIRS